MTLSLTPVSPPVPEPRAAGSPVQGTGTPARATATLSAVAPPPVEAPATARQLRNDSARDKPAGPPPAFEITVLQQLRESLREAATTGQHGERPAAPVPIPEPAPEQASGPPDAPPAVPGQDGPGQDVPGQDPEQSAAPTPADAERTNAERTAAEAAPPQPAQPAESGPASPGARAAASGAQGYADSRAPLAHNMDRKL